MFYNLTGREVIQCTDLYETIVNRGNVRNGWVEVLQYSKTVVYQRHIIIIIIIVSSTDCTILLDKQAVDGIDEVQRQTGD